MSIFRNLNDGIFNYNFVLSATTDAFTKGDFGWIKASVRKLLRIGFFVVITLVVMLIFSETIYEIWLGDRVTIPFRLSAAWAFFVAMQTFNSIFIQIINGTGKIKLQMILGITAAILNIPLSILFAKYYGLGVTGVIGATIFTEVLTFMFYQIQYRKIINKLHESGTDKINILIITSSTKITSGQAVLDIYQSFKNNDLFDVKILSKNITISIT